MRIRHDELPLAAGRGPPLRPAADPAHPTLAGSRWAESPLAARSLESTREAQPVSPREERAYLDAACADAKRCPKGFWRRQVYGPHMRGMASHLAQRRGLPDFAEWSPRDQFRAPHCAELEHGELARHLAQRRADPGKDAPQHVLEIQEAHDALWYGRPGQQMLPWLDASRDGANRHLSSYEQNVDWEHPAPQALGTPLAHIYRHQRCQQQLEHTEEGEVLVPGGCVLMRAAQGATARELLLMAPRLEACCFEARKEEVLRTAVHLGRSARDLGDGDAAVLQAAALSLISSAASRVRDAHSSEFLVLVLEAMPQAGVGSLLYVDMLLSALYARPSGGALPPELARRAAKVLEWASVALPGHWVDGSSELGAASRRALAAIASTLRSTCVDEELASTMASLAAGPSGALPPRAIASGYCPRA